MDIRMKFFLYGIVARIVAIYLCVSFNRTLRNGLVERKIGYFYYHPDFLDWLFADFSNWRNWVAYRDATPVRYWIQIGIQLILLVACFFVAIFGWFH
jgi:hypothetical protein